jgi:plasmid stabilization system protein ParE
MRDVLLRRRAEIDLDEIWDYIAKDSPANANAVVTRVERAIDSLAINPTKGHTRDDSRRPNFLFWYEKPYLIAYRYDEKTVYIERVIHGRRDLGHVFRGR